MKKTTYIIGLVFLLAFFSLLLAVSCMEQHPAPGTAWAAGSLVVMAGCAKEIKKRWEEKR